MIRGSTNIVTIGFRAKAIFLMMMLLAKLGTTTYYNELSSLEKSVVDQGLKAYGLAPIESVQDQSVSKIYVLTESPFSQDSGLLTTFNYLHINSQEQIIRRDVFQKEGEPFSETLIRDSELALRRQGNVRSLAVIVPVVPKDHRHKDQVDLLVVTKDIVSLRPTFDYRGSFDTLTYLMVALGENNFLGLNKAIAAIYEYQQGGHILSASYSDPRLFGSPLQFKIRPSIILKRHTFDYDGFMGEVSLERPLLTEEERFGYGLSTSFGSKPVTDFRGNRIRTLDIPKKDGSITRVERYRYRYGTGLIYGLWSFGRMYKNDVSLSYG